MEWLTLIHKERVVGQIQAEQDRETGALERDAEAHALGEWAPASQGPVCLSNLVECASAQTGKGEDLHF